MAVAISLLHPVSRAYVPVSALMAMAASSLVLLTLVHRALAVCWRIERDGRRWHLASQPGGSAGSSMKNATLLRDGFRSGSHLVLTFRDERHRHRSLTVWRDAVDPETFSLLRLALLDVAERSSDPADRADEGQGERRGERHADRNGRRDAFQNPAPRSVDDARGG